MILYTVLLVIRLYKLLQYCKSCGHANKAITTTTTTTTTSTTTTTTTTTTTNNNNNNNNNNGIWSRELEVMMKELVGRKSKDVLHNMQN